MGTFLSMSGFRPSSVAALGALNVAKLALFGKALRSACGQWSTRVCSVGGKTRQLILVVIDC